MKKDILSQHLLDTDFLNFAVEYNGLITDSNHKKATELGVLLGNIQEKPGDRASLGYLLSVEEFTQTLLHTLENYRSHDMLDRVLKTFSYNQVVHLLGNELDVYRTPSDFTSIFYNNKPHGLNNLSVLGQAMQGILIEWNTMPVGTALGVYYYINLQTGSLIIEVKIGSTKPHPNKKGFDNFFASKVLYTATLDRNATFEYLNYRYPDKTLFEIFGVSFDVVMSMQHDE